MKRKILGIGVALLLAGLGTYALITYVESAKDKAVADERLVDVYVLSKDVPQGATAAQIKAALRSTQAPAKIVADEAITDLDDIDAASVAAIDLAKGEQLLASRLVDANEAKRADVPAGYQELTVALEPERALGGQLVGGDTVGVVLSFDPFDRDTASATQPAQPEGDSAPRQTPSMTHLTFSKVLVTGVKFDEDQIPEETTPDDTSAAPGVGTAPRGRLLVTLALTSPQVEQVVFASEFGHIWLTNQGVDVDETGSRIVTLGEAFQPEVGR